MTQMKALFNESLQNVPGHALHEKGLQRHFFLFVLCCGICRIKKPGHTTGDSGQSAWRSTLGGSSKTGCQRNYVSKRNTSPPFSPRHRDKIASTTPQKHEQAKSFCEPTGEQNHRLTNCLPADYQQFISDLSAIRRQLCSLQPRIGMLSLINNALACLSL